MQSGADTDMLDIPKSGIIPKPERRNRYHRSKITRFQFFPCWLLTVVVSPSRRGRRGRLSPYTSPLTLHDKIPWQPCRLTGRKRLLYIRWEGGEKLSKPTDIWSNEVWIDILRSPISLFHRPIIFWYLRGELYSSSLTAIAPVMYN